MSEQAGNPALLLEIVAANHLPILPTSVSPEIRKKAFELFEQQMNKTDNTRLGYKVNRKKEALLFIQHSLNVKDPLTRLNLYFQYIKQRFLKRKGKIIMQVKDKEVFDNYIRSKIEGIRKMIGFKSLSKIEREAAQKLIAAY